MFRDRDDELERLEKELLEDPELSQGPEKFDRAWNTDACDEDLTEYSEAVLSKKKPSRFLTFLAIFLSLLACTLAIVAILVLRRYGGGA